MSSQDATTETAGPDGPAQRQAFKDSLPAIAAMVRTWVTEFEQLPDWADMALRARDPAKRRVAVVLALLEKPRSVDDRQRFDTYAAGRRSLALLNEAKSRIAAKRFDRFSPRRATLMASLIADAAKRHIDALERRGADSKMRDAFRPVADEPAVERVLMEGTDRKLLATIRSFLSVAVMNQYAALERVEHPALTQLRRADAAIDEAMRAVDAEAALIALYVSNPKAV